VLEEPAPAEVVPEPVTDPVPSQVVTPAEPDPLPAEPLPTPEPVQPDESGTTGTITATPIQPDPLPAEDPEALPDDSFNDLPTDGSVVNELPPSDQ